MTLTRVNQPIQFTLRGFALFTSLLVVSMGAASAKDHKNMKPANKPRVVAHIQFDGMSQVDMTIQARPGDKYYLYVQHSKGEGVSIIDISSPSQPKAIGVLHEEDAAGDGRMTITGKVAIVSENATSFHRGETSNGDVLLWDTSDPTSPRLVQKFSNVVKWLQDDRELIYVLAGDGLWIVSQPQDQPHNSSDSAVYGG